jgi:hypothetical protein
MKSGKKFDHNDPIMQNVIFDVDRCLYHTDIKMQKLRKQIHNTRCDLYKFSDYKAIPLPDASKYDKLVESISTLLFDDMSYERICTREQVEWKEYFHGLYDLVVFPYQSDHTHYLQMVHEVYKYFDILDRPKKNVEPFDSLYVDIRTCDDLFKRLKTVYKEMMIPKFFKKIKRNIERQVEKRVRFIEMDSELEKLSTQRLTCSQLLKWASS